MRREIDCDTAVKIIHEINAMIGKFREDFPAKFKAKYEEELKSKGKMTDDFVGTFNPYEIVNILMFGEIHMSENIITKVDYNKNKSSLKTMFFNQLGFGGTVSVISWISIYISDFLSKIHNLFETVWISPIKNNDNEIITNDEVERLYEFLSSASWEATHMGTFNTMIKDLLKSIKYHKDTRHLNKDVLKRFYFTHVYELKNSVKLFDIEDMCFGETNNIMRMFNKVYHYVFGDFIGVYNTLNNHFKVLTSEKKPKT